MALSALPGIAPHELIVIGDRIFTDVVLAQRLVHARTARLRLTFSQQGSSLGGAGVGPGASVREGGEPMRAPLAVWTTGVWMRWAEKWLVHLVERWVQGVRECRDVLEEQFVKRVLDNGDNAEKSAGRAWFSWVKGALPKLRCCFKVLVGYTPPPVGF